MSQNASPAFDNGLAARGGAPSPGITDEIRAILADSGCLEADVTGLSDEADLYAAGLTSHGTVNLMLALEERFDIEFPDAMLRRRTFESIAAIRAAVEELSGAEMADAAGRN